MAFKFTLRQLGYFVAVSEANSMTTASQRAHVSLPSVSGAIARLEQEFGIQLFIRHHAEGISLTPEGRRIYQETKTLLAYAALLHTLVEDIAAAQSDPPPATDIE